MSVAIFSKQEIVDIISNNIKEYIAELNISEDQLFCIIDKYLISENVDGEEFAGLRLDNKNERLKSIKLRNGFFNFKESIADIIGVSADFHQVGVDVSNAEFGVSSVLLILKIIAEIYGFSKADFGKDEYFIITKLMECPVNTIKEDKLVELYLEKVSDNMGKEDAKNNISNAISNLEKYKCIDIDSGYISLLERIIP